MAASLSRRVGESVSLLFFRKVWGNVINLLVMTVLARLLSKEDFGLLAISAVLLSFINTLSTSGLSDYLIYYDKSDSKQVFNAVFWLNFFLTTGVCVVIIGAAPFWANFYESEKIRQVLWLLLVSFFFEMSSMVPRTALRKDLQYNIIVRYSTIFMTCVSAGKLIGAFSGMGVFSLVLPQAILSPVLAFAFFLKTGFRPLKEFGARYYRGIIQYSKHLVGARILNRLVNDGDNLIVGKVLGIEALGVYNLAFQLANLVTTNIVLVVNDVIMPVLSKVRKDPERLNRVFLDILGFLVLLSFPLITTLAVFSEPFVSVFYGAKWIEAAALLQILCLFALGRSINSPSSILYNALGRPDVGFKFTLFFAPIFIASIFWGSSHGIIAVAVAVSVVRFLGQFLSTTIAFRLANIKSNRFYQVVARCFVLSLVLLFAGSFLIIEFRDFLSDVAILCLMPLFGYGYALLMRVLITPEVRNALIFLKSQNRIAVVIPFVSKILFLKA